MSKNKFEQLNFTYRPGVKRENYIEVEFIAENGTKEKKTMRIEDFAEIFTREFTRWQGTKKVEKQIELTDTRFIAKTTTKKGFITMFEVPVQKWFLIYGAEAVEVNLPKLIVKVDSDGDIQIATTKAKNITINTKLLQFDFPNMLSGFNVCFGSFKKRKLNSVDQVFDYFTEFFAGTPFTHSFTLNVKKNNDGTHTYKHVKHEVGTLQDFLKYKE